MVKKLYNFNFTKSINNKIFKPSTLEKLKKLIKHNYTLIGNCRSYGDCQFGSGKHISMIKFNKIINLDKKKKIIELESGVKLFEMLDYCVKRGFFLNCMPGCKYVSIGGMIANNISGKLIKNNHLKYFISSLKIINNQGEIVECSKSKNIKLYNLTIGGKGRTGPIISAKIKIKKLSSEKIYTKNIIFNSYFSFLNSLKNLAYYEYGVAWLDFTLNSFSGILFLGKHYLDSHKKNYFKFKDINLPSYLIFIVSCFVQSKFFTKIFNKIFKLKNFFFKKKYLELNDFFFPQNKIKNWNFSFLKEGFLQFQFYFKKKDLQKLINSLKEEMRERYLFSNFVIIKFHNNDLLSISLDFPINKNKIKIKKFINYFTLKHNLNVELSKDIYLSKLTKKTLRNNPIFNNKYSNFFFKKYKSDIFKRLAYK